LKSGQVARQDFLRDEFYTGKQNKGKGPETGPESPTGHETAFEIGQAAEAWPCPA